MTNDIITKEILEKDYDEEIKDNILTYSGVSFYPLNPNKDDIKIDDIAHALSLMTRANGHFKHFYSVGQHSINCYKEAKNRNYSYRVQMECLLHDASEAYLADITRPVKKNMSKYFVWEDRLQKAVFEKIGLNELTDEEKVKVKSIDDSMLYYEFVDLMGTKLFSEEPFISMDHNFEFEGFDKVEDEFKFIYNELKGKILD
ncbi:phosphohydrolase [Clostridium cadaveris]|uniref:phosphohydrolase n=1 Tax=Clostridium cadaveris TaxID=1529 RepID=UPI001F30335E|nr:phosphohydrolase [Clostridium cadaveris]